MRTLPRFEETLEHSETVTREDSLGDRLQAYSRLLALAADELAALERSDTAKRRELADERDELTREILLQLESAESHPEGEARGDEEFLAPPLAYRLSALLAEALDALEQHEEEERQMQDRLASLEENALRAIHVGGRIVSLRSGRYEGAPPLEARFDVRF